MKTAKEAERYTKVLRKQRKTKGAIMKKTLKTVARVIFILSLAYYIFWILYAIFCSFTGIASNWLMPVGSGTLLYGIDGFVEGLGVGIVYTELIFWFIPVYQLIYIITIIIIKIVNKIKARKNKNVSGQTE